MPQCYVNNCTNYYGKTRGKGKVSYHMIPALPALARRWGEVCTGRDHVPSRHMRVCNNHFSDRCYQRDLQHELLGLPLRRRLRADAVPDINLPDPDTTTTVIDEPQENEQLKRLQDGGARAKCKTSENAESLVKQLKNVESHRVKQVKNVQNNESHVTNDIKQMKTIDIDESHGIKQSKSANNDESHDNKQLHDDESDASNGENNIKQTKSVNGEMKRSQMIKVVEFDNVEQLRRMQTEVINNAKTTKKETEDNEDVSIEVKIEIDEVVETESDEFQNVKQAKGQTNGNNSSEFKAVANTKRQFQEGKVKKQAETKNQTQLNAKTQAESNAKKTRGESNSKNQSQPSVKFDSSQANINKQAQMIVKSDSTNLNNQAQINVNIESTQANTNEQTETKVKMHSLQTNTNNQTETNVKINSSRANVNNKAQPNVQFELSPDNAKNKPQRNAKLESSPVNAKKQKRIGDEIDIEKAKIKLRTEMDETKENKPTPQIIDLTEESFDPLPVHVEDLNAAREKTGKNRKTGRNKSSPHEIRRNSTDLQKKTGKNNLTLQTDVTANNKPAVLEEVGRKSGSIQPAVEAEISKKTGSKQPAAQHGVDKNAKSNNPAVKDKTGKKTDSAAKDIIDKKTATVNIETSKKTGHNNPTMQEEVDKKSGRNSAVQDEVNRKTARNNSAEVNPKTGRVISTVQVETIKKTTRNKSNETGKTISNEAGKKTGRTNSVDREKVVKKSADQDLVDAYNKSYTQLYSSPQVFLKRKLSFTAGEEFLKRAKSETDLCDSPSMDFKTPKKNRNPRNNRNRPKHEDTTPKNSETATTLQTTASPMDVQGAQEDSSLFEDEASGFSTTLDGGKLARKIARKKTAHIYASTPIIPVESINSNDFTETPKTTKQTAKNAAPVVAGKRRRRRSEHEQLSDDEMGKESGNFNDEQITTDRVKKVKNVKLSEAEGKSDKATGKNDKIGGEINQAAGKNDEAIEKIDQAVGKNDRTAGNSVWIEGDSIEETKKKVVNTQTAKISTLSAQNDDKKKTETSNKNTKSLNTNAETSNGTIDISNSKIKNPKGKIETSNSKAETSNERIESSKGKIETSKIKEVSKVKFETSNNKLEASKVKIETSDGTIEILNGKPEETNAPGNGKTKNTPAIAKMKTSTNTKTDSTNDAQTNTKTANSQAGTDPETKTNSLSDAKKKTGIPTNSQNDTKTKTLAAANPQSEDAITRNGQTDTNKKTVITRNTQIDTNKKTLISTNAQSDTNKKTAINRDVQSDMETVVIANAEIAAKTNITAATASQTETKMKAVSSTNAESDVETKTAGTNTQTVAEKKNSVSLNLESDVEMKSTETATKTTEMKSTETATETTEMKSTETATETTEKKSKKLRSGAKMLSVSADFGLNNRHTKTDESVTFKIPMRSSVRLARRETFRCAADFKSPKLTKKTKANPKRLERDRFVRKIKYMRQLDLNFLQNVPGDDKIVSPKAAAAQHHENERLNKMHIMEDVREGCDTQPSSPGHAEQRAEITAQTDEETGVKTTGSGDEEDCKLPDDENSEHENGKEEKKQDETVALSPKRSKSQSEDVPAKKPKNEIAQDFYLRNKILGEYAESIEACGYEAQTEQLIVEIHGLAELAKEKEREWNRLIHERKLKEELLVRLQRQKQVYLLSNGLEITEGEESPNGEQARKYAAQRRLNRPKLQDMVNGHDGKLKQRPVRDVQSIIADFRQRHPETVPRRGRRIRSIVNGDKGNGSVLNFSNVALGSGSQVRQNASFENSSELGMLLSAMESQVNQDSGSNSESQHETTTSFKDILVRFAKLSQSERQELLQNKPPPPPYPEVTVHAVSTTTPASNATNSLLHGILTKTQNKAENKSSFSPTLARLLTAPERSVASQQNQTGFTSNNTSAKAGAANVSISDILSSNKARKEITITPVGAEYDSSPKRKCSQMDEEEAEDSVDRLVIDESGEIVDARTGGDNNSDTGDEVPQCQGCNVKAAQFVCAGCGNQWYCSRECQVTAWDEHSEVCSG